MLYIERELVYVYIIELYTFTKFYENVLKILELYTYNGHILWYVNYASIKL